MRLDHEFSIPAPPDQAWDVLMDVRRVGPCLPGAEVTSVDGDSFSGSVAMKIGPVNVNYQGSGHFESKDAAARTATIVASGKDRRGQGSASATITARLTPGEEETHVAVTTDLTITGRLAQFGRGPINQVSAKILTEFSERLAAEMGQSAEAAPDATVSSTAEGEPPSGVGDSTPPQDSPQPATEPAAPLDLMEYVVGPKLRRYAYGAAALLGVPAIWLLIRWWA